LCHLRPVRFCYRIERRKRGFQYAIMVREGEIYMDSSFDGKKRGNEFFENLKRASRDYTLMVAIIIMFIFFSLSSEYFLTFFNMRNIIQQMTSVAILGIGASIMIIAGGMDISLGQNLCMSSCAAGWLIKYGGWNAWLALLVAMILGMAVGSINGAMRAYIGIPTFVTTLGTQLICRGIAKIITDCAPIPTMPPSISWIGTGYIGGSKYGVPISVIIMLVMYAIFSWILKHTMFGRSIYAIGGGPEAAYFAGINVKKYQFIAHVLGGAIAAFSGIVLMTRIDSVTITNGQGYEFDCVIACVMGGISLSGGRGKLVQSLMGALFLMMFFNGVTTMNVNPYVQDVLKGGVLLLAIVIDVIRTKQRMSV